jgi:hypothetical protein
MNIRTIEYRTDEQGIMNDEVGDPFEQMNIRTIE